MDRWDGGNHYDVFMGRWSRLVADRFVGEMEPGHDLRWLDVGCGTGALLESILVTGQPSAAAAIDPSPEFAAAASDRFGDVADIRVAGGEDLPFDDGAFDVIVSGLALNFIPNALDAIVEWKRVASPGGTIGAYVWDYAEGMEFLRYFWDAVVDIDPGAQHLDEALRFPICRPEPLRELFEQGGLSSVVVGSIVVETTFPSFEDYWSPFLSGQGPAPSYVASLDEYLRDALAVRLRAAVPTTTDGVIDLRARAWTVAGTA